MKLLLDTHTLIWYLEGSDEISQNAIKHIENPDNQCYVSLASLWEMSIKISLGKLMIKDSFDTIQNDIFQNGFDLLPITFEHISQNATLPWHHKDPFDRLIISQCLTEGIPVISRDAAFDDYMSIRIW